MVHYQLYEKPPLVPVSALPTNFFQVRSNISPPSRSRSCKWSLSLRFLSQNSVCTPSLHHICLISVSFFFISFCRIIFGEVQYIKIILLYQKKHWIHIFSEITIEFMNYPVIIFYNIWYPKRVLPHYHHAKRKQFPWSLGFPLLAAVPILYANNWNLWPIIKENLNSVLVLILWFCDVLHYFK